MKRSFGDEYAVVISDQDIYDWIYDAELDIIRHNADNDTSLQIPVTRFPISVPDRVNIKRLSVEGKALTYTTVSEIDLKASSVTAVDGIKYWYFQGGLLHLWPVAESTDKTIVEVTYSKTPIPMSVVAPYFKWTSNAPAVQYGLVASDDDWKNQTGVNVALDLALDTFSSNMVLLYCGGAGTDFHFQLQNIGGTGISFMVGNGSTSASCTLNFLEPVRLGERFRFRITHEPTENITTLYRADLSTGADILQSVNDATGSFAKQTSAAAPLYIGNINGSIPSPNQAMRIYSIELKDKPDPTGSTVFYFDGSTDLANLPGVIPNFTSLSGHAVQTFNGIVTAAFNEFTIPEVYHEDVVKFCLARAHNKNQNFRAAEAEMEQYDRRVSTRRNEAQAIDAPLYKIADPEDYY